MTQKDINQWKKERDAAVKTYDLERFKKFYEKWSQKGFYNIALPPDPILEISMRKMVCVMESATKEEKEAAKEWLKARGLREGI